MVGEKTFFHLRNKKRLSILYLWLCIFYFPFHPQPYIHVHNLMLFTITPLVIPTTGFYLSIAIN
jgi:hypothetical protein